MLVTTDKESIVWRDFVSGIDVLKDWGPEDNVSRWHLQLPWALKYMMSYPDSLVMRTVVKKNSPQDGMHCYAIIPYDIEKNINLESNGIMKIKTGVVKEHPDDPKRSILCTYENVAMPYAPDFVKKAIYKKMAGFMGKMTVEYKKTQMYIDSQ